MVSNCPVKIKGGSTGRIPIQVSKITETIKNQNKILFNG